MKIEIRKTYYDEKKTKIKSIIYHEKNNEFSHHREDGPAYQTFFESGQLQYEAYRINCQYHREDGPARKKWYENGEVEYEEYWVNHKQHREDGPAWIWYNEDGIIKSQYFYIDGRQLSEKEWKMKVRLKGTLLENKY